MLQEVKNEIKNDYFIETKLDFIYPVLSRGLYCASTVKKNFWTNTAEHLPENFVKRLAKEYLKSKTGFYQTPSPQDLEDFFKENGEKLVFLKLVIANPIDDASGMLYSTYNSSHGKALIKVLKNGQANHLEGLDISSCNIPSPEILEILKAIVSNETIKKNIQYLYLLNEAQLFKKNEREFLGDSYAIGIEVLEFILTDVLPACPNLLSIPLSVRLQYKVGKQLRYFKEINSDQFYPIMLTEMEDLPTQTILRTKISEELDRRHHKKSYSNILKSMTLSLPENSAFKRAVSNPCSDFRNLFGTQGLIANYLFNPKITFYSLLYQKIDHQFKKNRDEIFNSTYFKKYLNRQITLKEHMDFSFQFYYVLCHLNHLFTNIKSTFPDIYDILIKIEDCLNLKNSATKLSSYTDIISKKLWPETQEIINKINTYEFQAEKLLAFVYVYYRSFGLKNQFFENYSNYEESIDVILYRFKERDDKNFRNPEKLSEAIGRTFIFHHDETVKIDRVIVKVCSNEDLALPYLIKTLQEKMNDIKLTSIEEFKKTVELIYLGIKAQLNHIEPNEEKLTPLPQAMRFV